MLRLTDRLFFIGLACAAGGLLVHPVLAGQFNTFWTSHLGSVPDSAEVWLTRLLFAAAAICAALDMYGRLAAPAGSRLRELARDSWYPLRTISGFYIWLFRGTPLLLQIFFVYFALPQMTNHALVLTEFPAGFIALSLNEGAYMAEIVRAGITGVSGGQMEAAQSLGMTRSLAMRRVILPQAIRIIIPPTGNEFISMMKNTSLVSTITLTDLFYRVQLIYTASSGIGAQDFFNLLLVAAVWYLALTSAATYLQGHIERHFARGFSREIRQPGTMQRLMVGALRRG
ncbi:MAG TPA: amino acid ABC transporter permease [Chloroflexota bacterium]|nr:amino acid ABC transporter permease [Chloroflexota bacterium]